ncbi:TIGR04222 domain-containing membrane protein [Actinoplanes sp. CA-054009]
MTALIDKVPSRRLWIVLVADSVLVIVLGVATGADRGLPSPAVAGFVVLAAVVTGLEIRLRRRRQRAAYRELDARRAEGSGQRPWGLPDRLGPAELGLLAGGDRGALLGVIAWLRAAGALAGHPRDRRQQVAAGAAPSSGDRLAAVLVRVAGGPGNLYLPGLSPLRYHGPQRPAEIDRELTALRARLAGQGLLRDVDVRDEFAPRPWNSPWPVLVIALGLVAAPIVVLADGGLAAAVVLLTLAGMLTWSGHPVRLPESKDDVSPDGVWVLAEARRRHQPPKDDPRAIGITVALFGDDALEKTDPELHEIVRNREFYQFSADSLTDNGV